MPSPLRRQLLGSTILIAVLLSGAHLEAQSITPGTRLRITTPESRVVGEVRSSTADSLIVTESGAERRFAWREVDLVEHSLGRRGRPVQGALIGAGAAAVLTIGAVALSSEDDTEGWGDLILLIALPANAAIGAGVGAIAGLLWRTERWSALPVGRVSAEPAPGGGVRLTLRF